jgi:hypothetical protein
MAATKKKIKQPGDGDGGVRVERASDVKRARPSETGPNWINPHEPLPPELREGGESSAPRRTIMDAALSVFPDVKLVDNQLLAAVLIAQALDRLGRSLTEAAAVSRYRGM